MSATLDDLKQLAAEMGPVEAQLTEMRDRRRTMFRELADAGVPKVAIAAAAGCTGAAVTQALNKAEKAAARKAAP